MSRIGNEELRIVRGEGYRMACAAILKGDIPRNPYERGTEFYGAWSLGMAQAYRTQCDLLELRRWSEARVDGCRHQPDSLAPSEGRPPAP